MVVPVYNGATDLTACLRALHTAAGGLAEIIVVDDASTDDSAAVATRAAVEVLRLSRNAGPAGARNAGAARARGETLVFVDADVVVAADTIARVAGTLAAEPGIAAVFGSYDTRPGAPGLVSQYRNLLHHFVHQRGRVEAATFWAGCGAIRRAAFDAVGGFDAMRFPRPSIEDIELGYRLRRAGYRIVLDKALQVTHLKRLTLSSWLRTDVTHRALPWARLILETGHAPRDLNLGWRERTSVALVGLATALLLLTVFRPAAALAAAAALLVVIALNLDLLTFLRRERGLGFAAAAAPLHVLHYFAGGLGYLLAWIEKLASRVSRRRERTRNLSSE